MRVRFEELPDAQCKLLVPSIPAPAHILVDLEPRADDRSTIINSIYVLMSGDVDGWMYMPRKYSSYKTVWERYKKWSIKGVSKNTIMNSLVSRGYTPSGLIKT